VSEGYDVDGLIFFGYPLHPPGRPERIRDEHLYQVKPPMLFIEGTRDPFCPLQTLEEVRRKLPGHSEVSVIADGDHSFKVRKTSGRSTTDAWTEVVERAAEWIARSPE
jgi:predicted alpha/beta-hydrolase family hydrolase